MSSPCPRPIRSNEERNAGIKNSAKVTFDHFQISCTSGPPYRTSGSRFIWDVSFGISYLYNTILPKKYLKLSPNIRHDDWFFFVLNNKIQYKWNLKFHLEWLRMYYVINVLETRPTIKFSDRKYLCLTRRGTWVTIV